MTANIQCFTDPECTKELSFASVGTYLLRLAPSEGINGNTGAEWSTVLYLKNTGTRASLNTYIYKESDIRDYVSFSVEGLEEVSNGLKLGDLKEQEIIPVTFKVSVSRWTSNINYGLTIIVDYYTLPDIDTVFYNPYTDTREVAE